MSSDWITCYVLFFVVILLLCAISYCAARAGEELSRFYNELLREWTREAGHD
jgi:hypothetical protein